jgi:hypothetical protein
MMKMQKQDAPDPVVELFLSEIRDLRTKFKTKPSFENALPLCNRAKVLWDDARFNAILSKLHHEDGDDNGEYTMARAAGCLGLGLSFAKSMSGHTVGWINEALRIIEHRLVKILA